MISGPLANNEPSLELKELLKNLRYETTKLIDTYERIMDMGLHEGFSEKEVKDMVKLELKGVMTRHELYYMFNKEKMNQKSNENYQKTKALINQTRMQIKTQNADKNDTEQSSTSTEDMTWEEAEKRGYTINTKGKVIDLETEDMNIKDLENKTSKEPIETYETETKAAIQSIHSFMKEGYDPNEAVNIIKGNMKHIVQELINRTYTQKDEFICIFQKRVS